MNFSGVIFSLLFFIFLFFDRGALCHSGRCSRRFSLSRLHFPLPVSDRFVGSDRVKDPDGSGGDIHCMLIIHYAFGGQERFFERRVHKEIPSAPGSQLGKSQFLRLPVHVDRKVDQISLCLSPHIVFAEADSDTVTERAQIRFPRFSSVQRQVGISAADVISVFKRRYAGKYRMVVPELNDPSDILPYILSCLAVVPLGPSGFIVLAVRIVVAKLCIKVLISGIDQSCREYRRFRLLRSLHCAFHCKRPGLLA